jgi:hypothetical protein
MIVEAGREERRLAEARGDLHNDVPAITVIVDGGWSKRSHKHSYNAKSGVAVIFGYGNREASSHWHKKQILYWLCTRYQEPYLLQKLGPIFL